MPVVSVSMPAELIERLDVHAAEHDYTGRSEVVREGVRALLAEFDDDGLADRPLAGVVSLVSEFDAQRVERRVSELRHEYDTHVTATEHSHVGDTCRCESCNSDREHVYCVDLFVLEGDLETISGFIGRARVIPDVETVDYSLVPLDSIERLQRT